MNKERVAAEAAAKREGKKTFLAILVVLLGVFLIILAFAPLVILLITTSGPVTYMGYETDEFPLQGIYTPAESGVMAEERYLTTADGVEVWISEAAVDAPKAVVICLSGIRQPSVTYFYPQAAWLQKEGYASILLEVRGHGQSGGTRVALGFEEAADVRAVVEYITAEPRYQGVPIVIQGVSMGGAIAINAFGTIEALDGLIAMSAYSSFESVVYETMRNLSVPAFIAAIERPLTRFWLGVLFGNEAVERYTPVNQVKNIGTRSALFIAATGDEEVNPNNMARLLDAAPPHCDYWLREGWEHFIIKGCDFRAVARDEEYCGRILGFLEGVVEGRQNRPVG